jgi:hypothetical protein
VNEHRTSDRSTVWLPLLTRLTTACSSWGMWKAADSAFLGTGDIDSVAPREELPRIESEFVTWATEQNLGPVIACSHAAPFMYVLVALDRDWSSMFELDLTLRKTFRGSTLFLPADLLPLMHVDRQGVRRVRAGVEGVILLVHNGMRKGGRPDRDGLLRKRIRELLREDPDGVTEGAGLFGSAAGAMAAGARSVAEGGWNRRALLEVEAKAAAHALIEPALLAARIRFRLVTKRRCPLIRQVYRGRRVPAEAEAWMREVAETHRLYGMDRTRSVSPPNPAEPVNPGR